MMNQRIHIVFLPNGNIQEAIQLVWHQRHASFCVSTLCSSLGLSVPLVSPFFASIQDVFSLSSVSLSLSLLVKRCHLPNVVCVGMCVYERP